MDKDLVSIIIPVYNSYRFLIETIESVLEQTYQNWEMILIDDCSRDESRDLIKYFANRDKRIKYVFLEENNGVSNARNIGIRHACGKYIAFIDSDDVWYPSKLELQIKFMQENDYDFTYTSYELMNENSQKLNKIICIPTESSYKSLLEGNVIACFTVIINVEKIPKPFMPSVKHEDYATWLNILKKGYRAYGINENLGCYRKVSNSISSNKLKSASWVWNIYTNVEKINKVKASYYFFKYFIKGIKKHT